LPAGLSYVEVVAAGGASQLVSGRTMARRSDGTVVAWGENSLRQCNVPSLRPGLSYARIAAGCSHSAALVQAGSYETFAAGCAGSLPAATLTCLHLPRLGQNLLVRLDHLPQSAAIVALGLSNTTSPLGPLPLGLGAFGMPGCRLCISVDGSLLMSGSAGTVIHSLPIPNRTSLAGFVCHEQALVLDPAAANAAGAVVSDAATAVIGS